MIRQRVDSPESPIGKRQKDLKHALEVSERIFLRIVQNKKAHTVDEDLMLPCV